MIKPLPLSSDTATAGTGSQLVRRGFSVLTRGASVPASTTGSGWASTLAATAVGDFISSLGPISAAARLREAGVKIPMGRNDAVLIPRRSGSKASADVNWVSEGGPIPAAQYLLDNVQHGPTSKLSFVVAMTREQSEHGGGETVFSLMMREDIAASLDKAMFSANAAAPPVPAGLLYDVTPITAAVAGTLGPTVPMLTDLQNLAGAIVDNGGDGSRIVYIASPRQALAANLWLGRDRGVTIWPCAALTDGTVVAIQADCFVSSFGSEPDISITRDAPIIMNTVAAPFSTAGTPNVIAAPVLSSFQADVIGIRILLDAAWTMRAEGRVAVINDVTWGVAPS